jgi:ACS family glucarate transporter-like MFS transporter
MPQARPRWSLVAMLCATATAGYICRVNISTAGALFMQEFGLSQVAMGRVFSAFLLGYALFQVPGGAMADRWGARHVLSVAAWAWVALTALQAATGWGPWGASVAGVLGGFVALRFLMGIAAAPTYPAAAQGVSRWVPPAFQGRATGIVIASVGLGSAIAPPLVSIVMVRWGWRASMLVSAIPALVIAVAWRSFGEPVGAPVRQTASSPVREITSSPDRQIASPQDCTIPPPPSPSGLRRGKPARSSSLRSRSFALLTLSYSLQGYVGYIFVTWFYLYLVQERHFGLMTGAWMSSLPWILSIVSIPLGGFVADRLAAGRLGPTWGRRAVAMTGMAGSGLFISIGAHTASAVTAAVSLAVATALVLSVEGPFWSTVTRLPSARSGTAGGIMNTGCNIGGLLSPTLTPMLAASIGWEPALHVAAALAIVAALLWLGIGVAAEAPAVSLES